MAERPARRAAPVRRSPRAARPSPGRAAGAPAGLGGLGGFAGRGGAAAERPLPVPFAALFGGLVVAEVLYLAFLVRPGGSDGTPGWPAAALVALAGWVAAGAVLVLLGRGRGWLVLAAGSVLALLGLLALVVLFLSLGDGRSTWWAALLTVGPIGASVLACQRAVRGWTSR